jgi:hypothetical protein
MLSAESLGIINKLSKPVRSLSVIAFVEIWRGDDDGFIKIASTHKNVIAQLKQNLGWEQSATELNNRCDLSYAIHNHFEDEEMAVAVSQIIRADLESKGFGVCLY